MTTVVVLIVVLLLVAASTTLPFPRAVSLEEALRRQAADGAPVVVFRPGCTYCLRLRLRLGRGGSTAHWVDVRHDDDASARVRAATGGDETVPTVLVGGAAHVNPDPSWVRERLPVGPS